MKKLYHTQTPSGFERSHLPCPCGEHKGCYSERKDGSGYCFSCGNSIGKSDEKRTGEPYYPHRTSMNGKYAAHKSVKEPPVVPSSDVEKSLAGFPASLFCRLIEEVTSAKPHQYYTLGALDGDVIFWYRDFKGIIRNGKRIPFTPNGFNRDKQQQPTMLYTVKDGFITPFWGEEFLSVLPTNNVIIVESEKSAIYGQLTFPSYVWLGSGSANGCTSQKIERVKRLLSRRAVFVLFDNDFGGEQGEKTALAILRSCGIRAKALHITDIFPEAASGSDIADAIMTAKGVRL